GDPPPVNCFRSRAFLRGSNLASCRTTLVEVPAVSIRRLGSYAGTRVFFGYDRYLLPEIVDYREVLSSHGEVVEPIDVAHLHYLTSAELVCKAIQDDVVDGQDVFGILICGTG